MEDKVLFEYLLEIKEQLAILTQQIRTIQEKTKDDRNEVLVVIEGVKEDSNARSIGLRESIDNLGSRVESLEDSIKQLELQPNQTIAKATKSFVMFLFGLVGAIITGKILSLFKL